MAQQLAEEPTIVTESESDEAVQAASNVFTYMDIHYSGGVDSTPEEIQASTCPDCFMVLPATRICGTC